MMKIKGFHFITKETIVNLMKVDAIEASETRMGIFFHIGPRSLFVACDPKHAMNLLTEHFTWEPKDENGIN